MGLLEPFQSIAHAERALRRAEAAEAILREAMIELKGRFDRTFTAPRPARLVIHRTGRTAALRWRLAAARKHHRDFFDLSFDSDTGRGVLETLPRRRRQGFLTFQAHAISLNAAYALYRRQRDILSDHLARLQSLESVRAGLPPTRVSGHCA